MIHRVYPSEPEGGWVSETAAKRALVRELLESLVDLGMEFGANGLEPRSFCMALLMHASNLFMEHAYPLHLFYGVVRMAWQDASVAREKAEILLERERLGCNEIN